MNDAFWGLYQTQIETLKNCVTADEANMIMLETAKLLVENIDLSEAAMSQYDKFGIRKLFAAHNALGAAVVGFYDRQKGILDPAAQNGAIGQKMGSVAAQITETSVALEQLRIAEKGLLDKEHELTDLQKELEEWKQKISHLRHVESTALSEIQQQKVLFAQLDEVVTGYAEEAEFWENHLGENSKIVRAMSSYGISSAKNLMARIDELRKNVQSNLSALDEVIGKIVKAEENTRDAVLKKQNKIV